MKDFTSKHPTFTCTQDIADICRPLHKLNITYFGHGRIDNKGRFSALTNNPEFLEHYLRKKYFNADIHMEKDNRLGNIILWDSVQRCGETEKMDNEAARFGVRHTFTIVEKNPHFSDYYHYSTHLNDGTINQVYLANLELLKNFINNFNEKVQQSKELSSAYNIKFSLDHEKGGFAIKDNNHLLIPDQIRSEFIELLKIPNNQIILKVFHKENGLLVSLSKQQSLCLLLLMEGKTAKEIGCDIKLSYRTIEHYIARIRKILGCHSNIDLIGSYANQINNRLLHQNPINP